MTLGEILTETSKRFPHKTCISFEGTKITYSQIDKTVRRVSGGLKKLGLCERDRAAILMRNCPEYIITYFAIICSGGIAVPVNTFLIAKEVAYILNDSGCRILLYDIKHKKIVNSIKEHLPDIKTAMYEEIPEEEAPNYSGYDEETAVLLYTSGTTGFPKGAVLTHLNLISNIKACLKVMLFTHEDKVLLFLPLFHSFSFTVCVLLPIYSGATIVLLESVKPFSKVIKSILKDRITLFVGVPTIYNILVRKKIPFIFRFLINYFIKIRACVSGASALPKETILKFEKTFNLPLLEGYGLTEASPVIAVNPLNGVRKPGSVGPPLEGIDVAIVDDNNEKLKTGEKGELIAKGPNIMKGYFNMERETNDVLKEGWLYTGDMAKIDEDGYIYIIDRKKDLIIKDGLNIYPSEIETSVLRYPSVEECAMVGIKGTKGSEMPVLFIKKKDDVLLQEKEIRDYLKENVAMFKMPKKIIFLKEFPKTSTGKIKKNELRRWKTK